MSAISPCRNPARRDFSRAGGGLPRFPAAEAVSRVADPLNWTPAKRALMVRACREMALFHAGRSPEIAFLYKRRGFDPRSLRSEGDISRIPALSVAAMKRWLLTSLPRRLSVLKLTSSGTRGQKTQVWFDRASLDRVQAMLERLWEAEGLVSKEPANYLMFVYDPREAKDLGIAFSDKNQQRFAPVAATHYAIRLGPAGWEFRREETLRALERFAAEGKPVRVFGMPGFIFEMLGVLERRGPVALPPGSWMVTGGGWKLAEDKKVTREQFRAAASRLFGIPAGRIRDGYGMAEHSAPYLECSRHRFHVPVYNRIIIRDAETMRPRPPGLAGLMELVTPFNAMMPTLAILSTDLGRLDPAACPCGLRSPTFSLLGRAGLVKSKGCALHAAEIVRRLPAGAEVAGSPGPAAAVRPS